jgi:hypothetical protein
MSESTPSAPITVTVPPVWARRIELAGAVLGALVAVLTRPLVNWLISLFNDAPRLLELLSGIPLVILVPVLIVAGFIGGGIIVEEWKKDVGTVIVDDEGVTIERKPTSRHLPRETITSAFADKSELVILDTRDDEVSRTRTDKDFHAELREAFTAFGYKWRGESDPYEDSFHTWIEGSGDLSAEADRLLLKRHRALADAKSGAAADALDALRTLGISVRDRKDEQQYRNV